jgi:hypothetical protein
MSDTQDYMYVCPEHLACTSFLSILHVRTVLGILHARPSEYLTCASIRVSYMYVRSEYLTCTSV